MGTAQNLFGYTAKDRARESAAPVAGHDNQINAEFIGSGYDLLSGISEPDDGFMEDARRYVGIKQGLEVLPFGVCQLLIGPCGVAQVTQRNHHDVQTMEKSIVLPGENAGEVECRHRIAIEIDRAEDFLEWGTH